MTSSTAAERPILFVTGHAPPSRVRPFTMLAEAQNVHFALFGGRSKHALGGVADLPFPHDHVSQADLRDLAASGRFRAVVGSTGGRTALPGAWRGARKAGVPFVLWSSLWAHPRSLAGLIGYPLLRRIYRDADAVVTYGTHVSAYVASKRERGAIFEAPQAVDNAFWRVAATETPPEIAASDTFSVLFSGRLERAKGVRTLCRAVREPAFGASPTTLILVGCGPERARAAAARTAVVGSKTPEQLRNFYAASHVLLVPSIPTATFREPWGLVCNEAMNQGLPVIASDAVGAVAGGLVRHERNGLVVEAGDASALAGAIARLRDDPPLRERLSAAAREDVSRFTFETWVDGFRRAFESAGVASPADSRPAAAQV
jgi:glycosyltransferase involved in cell wall biosynthesis